MTDLEQIADAYVAAWNASEPDERLRLVKAAFTEGASFRDPMMNGEGHTGIDAMIAGVQERFAGLRFVRKGTPDGFAEMIRFSWALGPEGSDSIVEGTDIGVVEDGRLARVTGFFDKLPAH